ncbi:hypothetical protein [Micromonospora sp. L32]|uniref:hypothetical protein n=1 Tax=Micromonospora TaxID=1873 RepID=UPI003F8A2842
MQRGAPTAEGEYLKAFAAGAVLTVLATAMMPEALKDGGRLAGPLTVAGFAAAGALTVTVVE